MKITNVTDVYYWATSPLPSRLKVWLYILIGLSVLCVALAVWIARWLRQRPAGTSKRVYRRTIHWLAHFAIWTLAYIFLRYEQIPWLSMRLWYALFGIGMLIVLVWIWKIKLPWRLRKNAKS